MVRSVWKGRGPKKKINTGEIIWSRDQYILEQDVGKFVRVYNGNKFVEVLIEENMVGRSFGTYVMSRRMGVEIHIRKRKKK